jgi:hypothetical protein
MRELSPYFSGVVFIHSLPNMRGSRNAYGCMNGVGKGTPEAFDDDTCSHVDDSLVDRRPFPYMHAYVLKIAMVFIHSFI